jgi:hypothetical protein
LRAASQDAAQAVESLSRAAIQYDRARARVDAEDTVASRRISIGEARAQLLLAHKSGRPLTPARQLIVDLVAHWTLAGEMNDRLLYNLATWYAVAYAIDHQIDDLRSARRYVTYSLARDIKGEAWAREDPDLDPLRPWLAALLPLVHARLDQPPPLATLTGQPFEDAIDMILQAAGG